MPAEGRGRERGHSPCGKVRKQDFRDARNTQRRPTEARWDTGSAGERRGLSQHLRIMPENTQA